MSLTIKSKSPDDVSNKIYQFFSKIVDNRVLDVYLKFIGITTLTTTTMVPLALIFGKNIFSDYVKNIKNPNRQIGGQITIPVIDDPGIGTFLKLLGLYNLPFTSNTLLPIGVLMVIYQMYNKHKQTGGSSNNISLTKLTNDIFGNRVLDVYLKFLGITTLTPATLVPMSLLLGHVGMKKYITSQKTPTKQLGGMKIPLIDDPLLGNYLKIIGLYHLPITGGTMIPLGIMMVIYQLYFKDTLAI